jgi:protein-arginine kinase activator protein McsA
MSKEESKIEINVKNGDNFHINKDEFIQWLEACVVLNLEKENYEECTKLRDEIDELNQNKNKNYV